MKITVNKCPHTGQLFEDDVEYRRHMRLQVQKNKYDLEREKFAPGFHDFLKPMYEVYSFEELGKWISENYWTIARNFGYRNSQWDRYRGKVVRPDPSDNVVVSLNYPKFEEISLQYDRRPFDKRGERGANRDGWKEWGWRGRVKIEFIGNAYHFFKSEHLRGIGIWTGSGGGGEKEASYDFTMWQSDFHNLRRLEVMDKLARQTT